MRRKLSSKPIPSPLSRRVAEWSVLPTAALHGKILEMQQHEADMIDLSIGISDLPLPSSGKKAAIKAITTNNVPYTSIGGTSDLKNALIRKLKRDNGITAGGENLIVTTGAKQAVFQTLYVLTNPGDEVAVFSPQWPAYTQIMTMLGLKPNFLELDSIDKLSTFKVNKRLKVLILNNPHNPSGKLFTKTELTKIASFAKQHNLFVLTDESYEKLVYKGSFVSFATIDKSLTKKVITIFSISQSFSMMGWRLGYAVADKTIISAIEALQSSITAATSAVTQEAVTAILQDPTDYTGKLQKTFGKRRADAYVSLAKIPSLKCELPDSGPYFWCDISAITKDSLTFCEKFLEKHKVALMAGEAFGKPGWIRIAFNVQPLSVLEKAIERLSIFCSSYKSAKSK